jgi:hypothetical protein
LNHTFQACAEPCFLWRKCYEKKVFEFLLRAPIAIKEFGENSGMVWIANIGKSLHELAKKKIKVGWVS